MFEIYNGAALVSENPGEGRDTVRSYAWATTLPGNVEDLELVDAINDVSGTGNALANVITGNAGDNEWGHGGVAMIGGVIMAVREDLGLSAHGVRTRHLAADPLHAARAAELTSLWRLVLR